MNNLPPVRTLGPIEEVEVLIEMQRDDSSGARVVQRWLLHLSCLLATACYDPDARCGKDQEYDEELKLCFCRDGLTATPEGCEEPEAPAPVETEEETDVDEPEETDIDDAMDGGMTDAEEATDEATTDEPPMDEGPTGLGMACASPADCAGNDATYCDTFVTMGCLVEGCDLTAQDCPVGYECQDLSAFGAAGTVCVAAVCDLTANDCPEGFECCEPAIPGFPSVCLSGGCGG